MRRWKLAARVQDGFLEFETRVRHDDLASDLAMARGAWSAHVLLLGR